MGLKEELVKLAKQNPRGIRAHLLPILKEAAADRIWKLIGELKISAEGVYSIRIIPKSGALGIALRKFMVAAAQRKLDVTYDGEGITLTIRPVGPQVPETEEAGF
jgi:hypothetical protein